MSEIGSFSLTILLKKTACAGLFLTALYGCAIGNPVRGYVEATAWSANYSEEYIPDFQLQTADGVPLYLGGIQVKKFSNGGVGGSECCTPIPGVGSTIRVVWTAGDKGDRYSKDVVVTGATSTNPDAFNFLIVRFFPNHEIEAEFVFEFLARGSVVSPRVDKLFYGKRVMRYKGE